VINKEKAKEVAVATAKGVVSEFPFVGGLLAEYIGLAKDRAASNIMKEWISLVDSRLEKIENLETLADDEFFYSFLHTATQGAMKALQKEKREMYADALINAASLSDITNEKKTVFIWQLDKYSLVFIKVLYLLSQDNTVANQNRQNPMNHVYAGLRSIDDDFIRYVTHNIPELESEESFLYLILQTLFSDGLIKKVDANYVEQGAACAKKRTTLLGDEFVRFIKPQN